MEWAKKLVEHLERVDDPRQHAIALSLVGDNIFAPGRHGESWSIGHWVIFLEGLVAIVALAEAAKEEHSLRVVECHLLLNN